MIDEAPSIQRKNVVRPAKALVDALRSTPTGFLVDAMGGIDIDVVHADAGAAHDFEQGLRGEHGGGDLSLGAYGDGVHVLYQLEYFFRRGAVSLDDFEAGLRAQKGDSLR